MKKFILLACYLVITSFYSFAEVSAEQQLTQQLKQHHGKVIYLDFWASWCTPCRKSFPWMNKMQQQYAEQGFTVISINLDREQALAQQFLQQTAASFPVIYNPTGSLAKQYQLLGMPSSFVFGKDGKIKYSHIGFKNSSKPQYESEINSLLKQAQ